MKILFAITSLIIITSCNKEQDNSNKKFYNVIVDFQIFLEDSNGQNLLDPEFNGSYNLSEIMLYNDISLKNKVTDPFIKHVDGKHFLDLSGGGKNVFLKNNERIKYGTLYLKLTDTTIDTIYSETICKGESLLLNKVTYNSNTVFELGGSRAITVIK